MGVKIKVDSTYHIDVDKCNWTVMQTRIVQDEDSPNHGLPYETAERYAHDLSGALQSIISLKARHREDSTDIKQYLNDHNASLKVMTDRVLQQKSELKEALAHNKAM